MVIAFVTVLWSTKNYVVAALVAVATTIVSTSLTGALNLAGFDLDISTCLVLLVTSGVAFNYVTFFAVQYANSPFKSRT